MSVPSLEWRMALRLSALGFTDYRPMVAPGPALVSFDHPGSQWIQNDISCFGYMTISWFEPVETGAEIANDFQPLRVVLVIQINVVTLASSRRHMMESTRGFHCKGLAIDASFDEFLEGENCPASFAVFPAIVYISE